MGTRQRTIQKSPAKQSSLKVLSVFVHEEDLFQFSYTSLVHIWNKGLSTGLKNDEVYQLKGVGSKVV